METIREDAKIRREEAKQGTGRETEQEVKETSAYLQ